MAEKALNPDKKKRVVQERYISLSSEIKQAMRNKYVFNPAQKRTKFTDKNVQKENLQGAQGT